MPRLSYNSRAYMAQIFPTSTERSAMMSKNVAEKAVTLEGSLTICTESEWGLGVKPPVVKASNCINYINLI